MLELLEQAGEIKERGELGAVEELMIKRLLHKQSKIKSLFEKLFEQMQGQAPQEEDDQ